MTNKEIRKEASGENVVVMFKLIDWENGYLVYFGESKYDLKIAFKNYSDECEDDWWPVLTLDGERVDVYKYVF